jgi:hypothetical protein
MLTKSAENSVILLGHLTIYPRVPRRVRIGTATSRPEQQIILQVLNHDLGTHYTTKHCGIAHTSHGMTSPFVSNTYRTSARPITHHIQSSYCSSWA